MKTNNFKFYYGIPHAHTILSTGKGTPFDAIIYSKNNNLDFLIITDHNSYLKKDIIVNHKTQNRWDYLVHSINKYRKKNSGFLPVYGFETRTYLYGDFNIINPTTYFTGTLNNLKLLVLWMLNNPNAFIIINHPHSNILNLEYNEIFNKLITSFEVGNGSLKGKYLRFDKNYYALLDKGWKLGAVNGQDNHKLNWGDSENLTVFLAEDLSITSLVYAFRNRLTYSTESKTLKMYFKINDTFMGGILKADNSYKLKFFIFCQDKNYEISSIEIVTNHNKVIKEINNININSIKYLYEHEHNEDETWYLIRIHQAKNRLCISSPIFIES